MLPDLKLRQVGTRHVASVFQNGRNEDVGEVQEAHLRAYCASLPGSWQSYPKDAAAMSRAGGGANVRTFSKGEARRIFAQAVQTRTALLLSQDRDLNELEAHRLATQQVTKSDPALVAEYRRDIEKI